MKNPLSVPIFLFLLTSLFTGSAYSQALPDPGKDPIQPVDSVSQSPDLKPASSKPQTAVYVDYPVILSQPTYVATKDSVLNSQRIKEATGQMPLTKKRKTFTQATGIANY